MSLAIGRLEITATVRTTFKIGLEHKPTIFLFLANGTNAQRNLSNHDRRWTR